MGSGEPLLLIHGTPLDRQCWDLAREAVGPGRRLLAYDLRGHGSAAATPLPDAWETLAADAVAVLDSVGLERAHVLGHSFGGQVAQEAVRRWPARFSSLTVVCSRSEPFPPFASAAAAVRDGGIAQVGEAALARWFLPDALAHDDPAVHYARTCLEHAVPDSFATALRMISAFEADWIGELDVPSRWIAAERDPVGTPETMRASAERCGGTFAVADGAGHMLPLEDPRRLADLLDAGA